MRGLDRDSSFGLFNVLQQNFAKLARVLVIQAEVRVLFHHVKSIAEFRRGIGILCDLHHFSSYLGFPPGFPQSRVLHQFDAASIARFAVNPKQKCPEKRSLPDIR